MTGPSIGAPASTPGFAALRAERAVETRLVDGTPQAGVWDTATGERRVLTRGPHGVDFSEIEPDGGHVWWFDADAGGIGLWQREAFGGGPGRAALSGVPLGLPRGIGFSRLGELCAICVGDAELSRCFLGSPGQFGREFYAVAGYRCLIDISPNGDLLALAGLPDGPDALVLLDISDGDVVATVGGGRDGRLWALEFHPDHRRDPELLLMAETATGFVVATWSRAAGLEYRSHLTFPTTASARWYPDGSGAAGRRVLIQQEIAGRSRLLVADLDEPGFRELPIPDGTVHDLSCAPDGSVYYLWGRADTPATLLRVDAEPQLPEAIREADASAQVRDLWTATDYGEIHSFLTSPPTQPPWPTIFLIHGGPAAHDRDLADSRVDALRDAGYAVVRTNYRGSTGYGPQWQHGFGQRVGLAQIEDLAAVRAHLVAEGLADERRTVAYGYSWGGYLALLALGVQPELWSAGIAVQPIADYVATFATTTPTLRAVDVGLFGGTPEEFPERYAAASPITHVDRVRGPVLLIAATADDRCPPEQIERYAQALRDRGVPHRVLWRDGGHVNRHAEEQAAIVAAALGFLREQRDVPFQLLGATASRP